LLCFFHEIIPLVVALGREYVEELLLMNQIFEFCRVAASFNKRLLSPLRGWDCHSAASQLQVSPKAERYE